MQQMRTPGSPDKRWFCPDRDLVYALPRYFRQALFVRFGGRDERTGTDYGNYRFDIPGVSEQQLSEECAKIKRLFAGMRDCGFAERSEFLALLNDLNEKVLGTVVWSMFLIMLGEYREWCAFVAPKEPNDAPLDMAEFEKRVNELIRVVFGRETWWRRLSRKFRKHFEDLKGRKDKNVQTHG